MIDRLLQVDLDPPGQDYLCILACRVEAYEDLNYPIRTLPRLMSCVNL